MRKTLTLAAAVLLAAACLAASSPASASAAEHPTICRVGYNANGPDTLTNRWQEYIDICNTTGHAVNVQGWATEDKWSRGVGAEPKSDRCNTAVFAAQGDGAKDATKFQDLATHTDDGEGLWLPAGHVIRVYTAANADTNAADELHTISVSKPNCGYHGHYINNRGDDLYLVKPDGSVVDVLSFNFDNGYYVR